MKKVTTLFFAAAMMFSVVFIGDAISSNGNLSVNAQQVRIKRKRRGLTSRTYRGGKYVYRKSVAGGKYVYRKGRQGTIYVGKKSYQGGKWTYKKGKKGTKAAFRKTKNVLN